MKKTFPVVMLPTEKASHIRESGNTRALEYKEKEGIYLPKSYHLYILSDEEIKEGDWYIDDTNSVRKSITSDKDYWDRRKDYKKIIATTDKSLTIKSNYKIDYVDSLSKVDEQLPQLPESFIQAYIKAYNDCKPITEVDLEMDIVGASTTDGAIIDIKTRPDNTVIVHQSKMYSRDEVISLIRKAVFQHPAESQLSVLNFDKWIQDNL